MIANVAHGADIAMAGVTSQIHKNVTTNEKDQFAGVGGMMGFLPSMLENFIGASSAIAKTVMVDSRPTSDIRTRVEQDFASSSPTGATTSSSQLNTLATLTQQQLVLMTTMVEELKEINDNLQGSSYAGNSSAVSYSTKGNTKPRSNPNYFGLSFGLYGGNASKGYISDGVT